MKLLEYEAKNILNESDISVPISLLITKRFTPELPLPIVLKSQVPVGGRGKAGGVVKVIDPKDVTLAIDAIFALDIKGFKPKTILAEEAVAIKNEYYLSFLIDRVSASIKLMAHKNGGVEVESNDADSFLTLSPTSENSLVIGEQLAEYYDLPEQTFALQDLVKDLYKCFVKNDATLLEINPLILTDENKLTCGDCKMELDDAAAFRHPEWNFEDKPAEVNFVTLEHEGNVATIANGAGLAMATVDAVADAGLVPANFLDIGGGANEESVMKAFANIMEYPNIKAIVINIFAGITRCDEVAKAITAAKNQIEGLPPLCIRLAGTNFDAAKELLEKEHVALLPTLEDCIAAAKKEVQS